MCVRSLVYPFYVWWCLELFLAADAFFFNKYLYWSMWVKLSFDMPPQNSLAQSPFRVNCSILLLGLREGHSWPQLLEVGVSFDLFSVADAEDTGLWKDVGVNRMFVAIFFGIKNWALVFSLKYWHISMQSIFWQWWFWWYLIMLDVLRFIC